MEAETEPEEGLQMSFLDHLDELRKRLIYSAIGVSIAFVVCFGLSEQIYNFLSVPVKREARNARIEREKKLLGKDTRADFLKGMKEGDLLRYTFALDSAFEGSKVPAGTSISVKLVQKDGKLVAQLADPWFLGKTAYPAGTVVPEVMGEPVFPPGFDPRDELVITRVAGGFSLRMQVAMYAGVSFAIPFLLFQLWAFISPGLYAHEKKYIFPVISFGTALFLAGAAFAYYIAFPSACNFLLGWQEGFQSLLNADEYLDLILLMMLGFGLVFQIPTLAFILGRVGLITAPGLLKVWRFAIVGILIIAALVTPTPDPINMMILATPMLVLYFLSVGVVWFFGKPRRTDEEVA